MLWIDFIICLFFGYLGVHKFREKKIGMGILYIFTCGLFGIGWIYDSIKYLITAIKYQNGNNETNSADACYAENAKNEPFENTNKYGIVAKKAFLWILVAFFVLIALVSLPKLSSILALFAIILLAPIDKWQNTLSRFIKKGIKTTVIIILALSTILTVPVSDTPEINDIGSNISSEKSDDSSKDVVEIFDDFSNASTSKEEKDDISAADSESSKENNTTSEESSKENNTTSEESRESQDDNTVIIDESSNISTSEDKNNNTDSSVSESSNESSQNISSSSQDSSKEESTSQHTHSFKNATCTTPKICSSCGATEGQALGHNWKDATCSSPKRCTSCEAATGYALGHTFTSGKCSVCGTSDPNYVSETMVWIPTNGGKKYHTKSTCSQMIDPIQVTKTEAINQGFGACGRCYK